MILKKQLGKWKELLEMYDEILGDLITGDSIMEPDVELDRDEISVGFRSITTANVIKKYYMIKKFPDWLTISILNGLRKTCCLDGVKLNYYIYGKPHTIEWGSTEMKNRMRLWEDFTKGNIDVSENDLNYRKKRDDMLSKRRILESTGYLNKAELEYGRTLSKITIVLELECERNTVSKDNMTVAIRRLKKRMRDEDIKLHEIKIDIVDWMQTLGLFSLKSIPEINRKLTNKIVTDDILALLTAYKQGSVGEDGECLGMDIHSIMPIIKKFKANFNELENMLIAGQSGSGKSYFIKNLLPYFNARGFVVNILDYEGDEYSNYANYVASANTNDVKIVASGKGSKEYFEPMEIPDLTGDSDIDDELKETAINYVLSYFRLMVVGVKGNLSKSQESVLSKSIKNVYDSKGVTEDKSTWIRSKGLRIRMVYEDIKDIVRVGKYVDESDGNRLHKAARDIIESCAMFFEVGEARGNTFDNPMPLNNLLGAKVIVHSFGAKGGTSNQIDATLLAMRQLDIANITTQLANYCKYVKNTICVNVWDEYQRWIEAEGSKEIIGNVITGGRKRATINLIGTNDLASILGDDPIQKKIRQNINSFAIGKIESRKVRHDFCVEFDCLDIEEALNKIFKASKKTKKSSNEEDENWLSNRYNKAFCIMLDDDVRAIAKVALPKSLRNSKIFCA